MRLRLFAVATCALLLAGCATTSMFNPYPHQAQAFRQAASDPAVATTVLTSLDGKRNSADKMLYLMERARLLQLQNRYADSKTDFEGVIAGFEAIDNKASLTLSGTGAAGSSLLTNDNAIPYKGYGYERVMVHEFQALNYLGLGDAQGAAVELRRASGIQRALELKHEAELSKAKGDASKNSIPLGDYDQYFTGMDTVTGTLRNSFQNGYTFYTSAVIWEALGEYNDALVDFKKALELNPANTQLQQDVIRVNERIDGRKPKDATATPTGAIVVLFEQGFVPEKRPINLSLPMGDGTWSSIAFPVYVAQDYVAPSPLSVRGDDPQAALLQTTPLVDTSALAVKALKEQIPGMLVRQVLRVRAKKEMQNQVANNAGGFAQLATSLYAIVSEQADLRSWLTLPANAQGARLSLSAGPHSLEFASTSGSLSVPIVVRPGRTTIVRVVEVYGRLLTQTYEL